MASRVTRTRRTRTTYTPQQRAERDAADAAIRDGAADLLADPDAVDAMVVHLLTTTSPKLLRYSLRNVAMLYRQAEQRGMTLTDVDTYKGWRERGRHVRAGETGLRIVAPKGTETTDDPDTTQEPQETSDQAPAERTRFRMESRFDISQTEGIEDAEPIEPETVTDPAALLRATLTEQFERLGHTVNTADQSVTDLAHALADLLNQPPADRPKPTRATENTPASTTDTSAGSDEPVDPNAPQRTRLSLGEDYGTATATVRTDWTTGRVFYTLRAPRVTGTWTVSIQDPADTDHVARFDVTHGEDDGHTWYAGYGEDRPDRPVINGVDLIGATSVAVDDLDALTGWRINCRRPTGRYTSVDAPDRTKQRTAAVLRAILQHLTSRPDLPELHRVAARVAAEARTREETKQAQRLDEQIQELTAQRDAHTRRAEQLADLADDRDQLALFAC